MSDATPRVVPVTLGREPALPPAEDFAALEEQALTWLPDWCFGLWTDFNDHDPGIMMLEQLIYGLTELPYRAGLPIHELLADRKGEVPWQANSLYAPTEILPIEPVTAADFARLIYDEVPPVRYAAVRRLTPAANDPASAVPGLLEAVVAVDPDAPVGTLDEAKQQALTLLRQHENLGERFEAIGAEPFVFFAVQVDIELDAGADPEKAAANLYLAAKQALLPGPRFLTLSDALQSEPMDRALNGPLLFRGVLPDANLPQRWTWPEARERAAQSLLGVAGIKTVLQIVFPHDPPTAAGSEHLFLPGRTVSIAPLAGTPGAAGPRERRQFRVTFAPASAPQWFVTMGRAEAATVVRTGGENPPVQFTRLLPAASWHMPPLDDGTAAVGEYESIQNHFPRCFALQADGLPPGASAERIAQVRQLKGCLLVFEQLMANYFAQLANVPSYFSNLPQQHTIFTQPLAAVPDVLPLLLGYDGDDLAATPAERQQLHAAYWADPANPYVLGLQKLAEDRAAFLRHRTAVLEHLAARFNEAFVTSDQPTYETIANQENLLQAYPQLGFRRAQAAPMHPPPAASEARPVSGLEEKIRILLRRDIQAPPPRLSEEAGLIEQELPGDFYFVLEPIRFLPETAQAAALPAPLRFAPAAAPAEPAEAALPDAAAAAAPANSSGQAWPVPADAFQPSLFHVFINWTHRPLDAAFMDYAESLVLENAPAHLWHRFIWLETHGAKRDPGAVGGFLRAVQAWAKAGYPRLQRAAAAPAEVGAVPGTPAAVLFAWLLAHADGAPEVQA